VPSTEEVRKKEDDCSGAVVGCCCVPENEKELMELVNRLEEAEGLSDCAPSSFDDSFPSSLMPLLAGFKLNPNPLLPKVKGSFEPAGAEADSS